MPSSRSIAFQLPSTRHAKARSDSLWITRIGIASRINGMSYSRLMDGLRKAGCELNRKVLADMAVRHPESFAAVVDVAKKGLA